MFRPDRMEAAEAVLAVASDMHQVWIETNYLPEVQSALSSVSSLPLKMRVVVSEIQEEALAIIEANEAGDNDKRSNRSHWSLDF